VKAVEIAMKPALADTSVVYGLLSITCCDLYYQSSSLIDWLFKTAGEPIVIIEDFGYSVGSDWMFGVVFQCKSTIYQRIERACKPIKSTFQRMQPPASARAIDDPIRQTLTGGLFSDAIVECRTIEAHLDLMQYARGYELIDVQVSTYVDSIDPNDDFFIRRALTDYFVQCSLKPIRHNSHIRDSRDPPGTSNPKRYVYTGRFTLVPYDMVGTDPSLGTRVKDLIALLAPDGKNKTSSRWYNVKIKRVFGSDRMPDLSHTPRSVDDADRGPVPLQ
jgi:hypothetical protein